MKRLSLLSFGLLAVAGLVSSTYAQQYYLRGGFNGWDTSAPMSLVSPDVYSATVSGTAGSTFEYKVATADWASSWPGSNGKSIFNSSGSFTAYFIPTPPADGWTPTGSRVGYADPGQFNWDIMGSFNGWSSPVALLTTAGAGLYTGTYVVADPATYYFKFREAGNWDISIGNDFGNSAGDNSYTTTTPNETIEFQFDLPNGRWTVSEVPEPGLLSLLATGAAMLFIRRARKQA